MIKSYHHLRGHRMRKLFLIIVCINISGCLDGWTQQLPLDINYEERHRQTLERRS